MYKWYIIVNMHIHRFQLDALKKELHRPDISILLGPRQVGKTYLLKQLHTHAKSLGKKVIYFNLEIPADSRQFNQSPDDLFILLTSYDVVFIDEFHYLKNAAKLFKAIYDSASCVKLYVSGSSSIEIHKHIKESLAGRRLITKIGPLTIDEWRQCYPPSTPWETFFEDYMKYGGLPGVIHENTPNEKIRLLHDIYATYIQKDIKSLIKEEKYRHSIWRQEIDALTNVYQKK